MAIKKHFEVWNMLLSDIAWSGRPVGADGIPIRHQNMIKTLWTANKLPVRGTGLPIDYQKLGKLKENVTDDRYGRPMFDLIHQFLTCCLIACLC